VAGVAAALSCVGPLAGGVVEELLGWRAVIALPVLGLLLVPLLWRAVPNEGSGARLDLFGAVLVTATSAGLIMVVQSPSTGAVVAVVGALLLVLGVPAVAMWVRRIAVPAVLVADGWEPWQVGVALLPSAVTGLAAPRIAAPLLVRIGGPASLLVSGLTAAVALVVAAGGAQLESAVLLVLAVVAVTFAFGLGQPALMSVVGDAVPDDVRGVALGLATLMFLVGGGVGSAVVGGLGPVVGMPWSLVLLGGLALVCLSALTPLVRPSRQLT